MFTASNGWIDFRKMEDRVLYNIVQDTSSHRYVQELARDSTRGKIEAAEAGQWNGGLSAYGYRVQYHEVMVGNRRKRKPEKLVIFEPEAEIVRWLFRSYADTDIGLRGLAAELNRRGVPSPRGAHWIMATIRSMFNNPVYLGEVVWNKRSVGKFFGVVNCQVEPVSPSKKSRPQVPEQWVRRLNRHEAIIDAETFDRVQRKLIENQKRTATRRGAPFTFSGLLVCGHCGQHMIGRTFHAKSRSGDKVYTYRLYICSRYNTLGTMFCQRNGVPEEPLLRCVVNKLVEKLEDRYLNPANVQGLKDAIRQQEEQERQVGDQAQEEKLQTRIETLDAQISRAARRMLIEDDESLLPELRKELKGLKHQHAELSHRMACLRGVEVPSTEDVDKAVERVGAYVGRLREAFDAESSSDLASVLRDIVSRIELWFNHEPYGNKGTRCKFAEGFIFLREDVSLPDSQMTSTPGAARRRDTVSASLGGPLPCRRRVLEFPGRRGVRLPD
jgi:hypothetical protein